MTLRTTNDGGTQDGQVPTEQFSLNFEQIHFARGYKNQIEVVSWSW